MSDTTEQIKQYGQEIGAMLQLLDIPHSFKMVLVEIMTDLPLDKVHTIHTVLRATLEEQVGYGLTEEYQKQSQVIDQETLTELDQITA